MSNPIQSVTVKRFKSISHAPFDASPINVFIGANNSGKSTLVQVIHFGIGILQSIQLAERWGNSDSVSLSLSPLQLLYSPSMDLYSLGHNSRLLEKIETAIELSIVLDNGQKIDIAIRKGRNGNIHVTVENVPAAKELANLSNPYTIYSPGLAGIARHENFISNGVLLRTIARGDANLVFRNILLRLSSETHTEDWSDFMDDLRQIFPDIELNVAYREETDEFVRVDVNSGAARVPVELAGTGILQASGFQMDDTLVLAYYGCTSPHNLRPLLELIRVFNPEAKIVVHQDSDYLLSDEATQWETAIRNMHAEPFLTDGVNIESHYLDARHLARLNGLDVETAQIMLEEATTAARDTSIEKYVNGRSDIEKKAGTYGQLNIGQLAIAAPRQVDADPKRYRHAKTVLRELRRKFREDHGNNLRVVETSPYLVVDALAEIAERL